MATYTAAPIGRPPAPGFNANSALGRAPAPGLPPSMSALGQPIAAPVRAPTPTRPAPATTVPATAGRPSTMPVGGGVLPRPMPGGVAGHAAGPATVVPPAPSVTYGAVNYNANGQPVMGGIGPDGRPLPAPPTPQQAWDASYPGGQPATQPSTRPAAPPSYGGAAPAPGVLTPQQIIQQQYDREDAARSERSAEQARQDALAEAERNRGHETEMQRSERESRERELAAAREAQSGEGTASRAQDAELERARMALAEREGLAGRTHESALQQAATTAAAQEANTGRAWQSGEAATERTFGAEREDLKHKTVRGEDLEDETRQFERLPGLWNMFTGEGGANAAGGSAAPSMAALTPGQPSPADLAFARAKDKIGLTKGAQLRDLRHEATAGGFAGSGDEVRAMAGLLGEGGDKLSDFATAQALDEAGRSYSLEDQLRQEGIQKRGQNLSLAPSMLALTQRSGGRAY